MNLRAFWIAIAAGIALPACGGGGDSGSLATGASGASGSGTGSGAGSTGGSSGSEPGGADTGSITACGAYAAGDDLNVCTATYLGGSGADHVAALDIAPDGAIVFGGAIPGNDLGLSPTALLGGGDGVVLRLASTGKKVLSVTRLGKAITDLEVSRKDGAIAVSGDFGVALLDPEAGASRWQKDLGGSASRVAVGADGAVAALRGATISVFDASGAALGSFSTTASALSDLAVDGASQTVFVTGYKQDDGGACTQYKSTFIRAFGYDGTAKWTSYDWNHDQVGASSDCADSTGLALAMGRDGKLYYAGKSDGGNTVHQKDPRDLAKKAPNVGFDAYNQPFGLSGANAIGYYARFNPGDGVIEQGQFILTRKGDNGGNAAVPSVITADDKGNVFVGGSSAFQIENHDAKKIDGQAVGPYASFEAFALIASPDLSKRLTWTVFTRTGPADAKAMAAADGIVVFGAEQSEGQMMKGGLITVEALQEKPAGGGSEAFLSVWPGP